MPITAEETVGDGGADGIRHMAVEGVAAVGDDHHIGSVLDLDHPIPGVIHEPVVVLIRRQVAVAVIHGRSRPAYGGDLVLLVGGSCLGGAVGGDGVPVADGIVVPGLAIRG